MIAISGVPALQDQIRGRFRNCGNPAVIAAGRDVAMMTLSGGA